ncbi:hypothetical protein, variant [Aphanomyces invadans]|uniref:Phosphodiesterase n=1 Tax=Aphanomyces invadans TaxID=157072 RepID=A0A024UFP6_9STRA|nr:hypothetical protein H310_04701 [Aphanomyces invadans]XP_008867380.1 hypothetical protein, variant [Aphanomyces invadans]ETW04423.1 hypothetical protein H310_04701 [Aphanomyces invadans]ETW04424.1 hypothetical protein, variant [Aphanomyces invadans]|eukprot:XP_008867379.1 hypothetical protein H310_04701 [Aphanomyces invadans]
MPLAKQREALKQAARILRGTHAATNMPPLDVHNGKSTDEDDAESPIVGAVTLLRKLHQQCVDHDRKETIIALHDVEVLLHALDELVDPDTPVYAREAERSLHRTFSSNRNVFDDKVQGFINQNYSSKNEDSHGNFRVALRRASLVQRCIKAFKSSPRARSTSSDPAFTAVESAGDAEIPGAVPLDSPDAKLRVLGGRASALNMLIGVDMEAMAKKELAKISTWTFNVLELSKMHMDDILLIVGCACFDAENMCSHFSIPTTTLRAFFQGIQGKYLANPYHNAEHAADVMQSVHHFLTLGGLGTIISKRGRLATLVAAACHDVGHTGYSNNFHINTNDQLAIRYAYRSPLENMHCAVAFELLHSAECDILATLSDVEEIEVRNLIIDMVLATDNKYHSIYMGRLDGILQSVDDERIDLSSPDDQKLLLQVALHAADVSNAAKPWAIYETWTARIMTEFYAQGDQERALTLPISFGCDRQNPIPQAKMQAGFILGIVKPVFQTLSRVPKVDLKNCLDQLDRNLNVWQDQLATTA